MSDQELSLYSQTQLLVLAILPYVTAPLSLLGSITIVYVILSTRRQTEMGPYNRLMLGLCTMDILNALGLIIFGSWAVPKTSDLAYGASGNATTCTVSGFFPQFAVGNIMYTACLTIYYMLSIRLEKKDDWIARRVEPIFHVVSILWTLGTGIAGAALKFFNPLDVLSGWCWFADYPENCSSLDDVPCLRGENYKSMSRIVATGTGLLCFIVILGNMVTIVLKVRATEKRMLRYSHGTNMSMKLTMEAGKQALSYIGFATCTFLLQYWPSFLLHCRDSSMHSSTCVHDMQILLPKVVLYPFSIGLFCDRQ